MAGSRSVTRSSIRASRRESGQRLLGDPRGVQPAVDAALGDQLRRAGRAGRPGRGRRRPPRRRSRRCVIRCAMVTDVRPRISRSSARPIRISSAGSTALVASSRTSRSGSARWARSRATSCRSPADSDSPRWPTWVSRPARQARRASRRGRARRRGEDVLVGRVEPAVADVGGSVSSKRKPSCGTSTTAAPQRGLRRPRARRRRRAAPRPASGPSAG